jgi:hypothetical protein
MRVDAATAFVEACMAWKWVAVAAGDDSDDLGRVLEMLTRADGRV